MPNQPTNFDASLGELWYDESGELARYADAEQWGVRARQWLIG
jgi:hypothetical protein